MIKSPAMHLMCKIVWLITGLASVNIGLMPFEYNFFDSRFIMEKTPWLIMPAYYIIGIAGVISLAVLAYKFVGGNCGCNCNDSSSCR